MSEKPSKVRKEAAKKMLWSVWVLPLIPAVVYLSRIFADQALKQFLVFGCAILCVPFLMHLIELVSGMSFLELARRWDGLKGWQRGVIGVAICGGLLLFLCVFLGTLLPLVLE